MKRFLIFAPLCLLLMGATCTRTTDPPVIPEPSPYDEGGGGAGGTGGEDSSGGSDSEFGGATNDLCQKAETRLRSLGCPWKTPAGTRWATVCRELKKGGRDIRPDCVARLKSCDGLERAINLSSTEAC